MKIHMSLKVYYHPACYTSYSLIKAAKERNLNFPLIDVSKNMSFAISKRVLTVPLIEKNGEFIYGGPINIDVALKILSGEEVSLSINNPIESFGLAVVDSAAASSIVLTANSAKPLLDLKDFIIAATGLSLDENKSKKLEELQNYINLKDEEFVQNWRKKMLATLSYNFMRERMYLGIDGEVNEKELLLWIVGKTSIGRAGVPYLDRIDKVKALAKEIHEYIAEREQKIKEKLNNEINEIKSFFKV